MSEEPAFLQAMQENPQDDHIRLVFADWLEERGDQKAELVRLTLTLTQSVDIPGRSGLETRLRGLLNDGVQPIGPFWTNDIGMQFAWVPPGVFLMGSPSSEEGRSDHEILHKVTLTRGFWMGVHLVTQEQFHAALNEGPNYGEGVPIDDVSWDDCQKFILKLRECDGRPYRLPTEAEWEYACRAGTTTAFYFGDTIANGQADCNGYDKPPSNTDSAPVGSFPANAFGLHDMHGNLWEWCADYYGEYPQHDVVDPQERKTAIGVSTGAVRGSIRLSSVARPIASMTARILDRTNLAFASASVRCDEALEWSQTRHHHYTTTRSHWPAIVATHCSKPSPAILLSSFHARPRPVVKSSPDRFGQGR